MERLDNFIASESLFGCLARIRCELGTICEKRLSVLRKKAITRATRGDGVVDR